MASYKLTTLFNLTTALSNPAFPIHRSAGWSETLYGNFASIQALLVAAAGPPQGGPVAGQGGGGFFVTPMWVARAALLPLGASILGARVQQVDVPGPVQTLALNYAGVQSQSADIPQMAVLIRSPGLGVNNIRRFTIRCIPDLQITEGEYQPTQAFNTAMQTYIGTLSNWAFRAKAPSGVKFKVINITAAGIVTTEQPHGLVVNQMVRITKSKDSGSNLRGGRFQVSVVGPGTTVLQLYNWTFGITTGGTITGDVGVTYPNIDAPNTIVGRAVTRRVGRPFVAYRGRRSKKR